MKELGEISKIALARAASAEGRLIRATQLLDIADRAHADQTLKRLADRGELVRVGRGLYVAPVESKFGRVVERDKEFLRGLEKLNGEKISYTGAMEALHLGITTQVPVRSVFWTTGKARKYSIKKSSIEFRTMPHSVVSMEGEWGAVVRAIAGGFDSSTELKKMAVKVKHVSPPVEIFSLKGILGEKARSLIESDSRLARA